MLARRVIRGRLFWSQSVKAFSTEKPTQEEVDAGRAEWGIKYDDECLKFEKEWKTISERVQKEQSVYIEKELSDLQQKKVDMLADKVLDLNVFELRYF